MSSVKLVNITKSFDEKIVLQDINIDIKDSITRYKYRYKRWRTSIIIRSIWMW